MRIYISIVFLTFFSIACFSQTETGNYVINKSETENLLKVLSSDKVAGRNPNHEGYDKAAKFIETFLLSHDISTLKTASFRDTISNQPYRGFNILAQVGDFIEDRATIVLGAHLDHLGIVNGKIYNGANDNATGCVALMQVAAYLSQFEYDKNIIIAFFTAEEIGMLGSKDFAKKLALLGITPEYMINFEMLGVPISKKYPNQVYLSGYEMSNMAEKLNESLGHDFVVFKKTEYRNSIFKRSDNYSFYEVFEIPAHTLIAFTGKNYSQYHMPSDDYKRIDTEFLFQVITQSAKAIHSILESNEKVELVGNHKKILEKNTIPRPRFYQKK